MCTIFFFPFQFVLFFRGPANDRAEGQRASCPSQSWSCCSTFPKQTHSRASTERRGCWLTAPPLPLAPFCCPEGRAACHLRLNGQRLPWARVVVVQQPLPVAQRGKKNAEPGKSLSVSSGVEGTGIDRAGAARAWCHFGIGGERAVNLQPLGFASTPGLFLALCAYWCHHVI